MAKVTGVKGPGFPAGEAPKISSTLAHNIGQVDHAAKAAILQYGAMELSGRLTLGPADETAAFDVASRNMLRWHPFL